MNPSQLLLCYYGDDFTGSTDAMESLALCGVKTALFLKPPTKELLESKFPEIQCLGVAGSSRSMTPREMEKELPASFQQIKSFNSPLVHYKVCSTFDSSPEVGSIGKVLEIGKECFPAGRVTPILAGAPALGRYTVFGHHFARAGDASYRLDRHPTMSRHPITPMDESDLRIHLGRQTACRIELMDIHDLDGDWPTVQNKYASRLSEEPDGILFDVLDSIRLKRAGQLIWEEARNGQTFIIGSSGVQSALTAYWLDSGLISPSTICWDFVKQVDQLVVISGSCSPMTQNQIEWAQSNGFAGLRVPMVGLVDPLQRETTITQLINQAQQILKELKSPLLYTAFGPDDPEVEKSKSSLAELGWDLREANRTLGQQLGRLLREVLKASGIRRAVIAGGDTSSHATRELGIYALEMAKPLDPGVPLCRSHSEDPLFDGLELALKGGQMGGLDFFVKAKSGH